MKVYIEVNNENDFGFLVSNIVLAKDGEFTFEEILNDIKKYKIKGEIK